MSRLSGASGCPHEGQKRLRTRTISNCRNPEWNETSFQIQSQVKVRHGDSTCLQVCSSWPACPSLCSCLSVCSFVLLHHFLSYGSHSTPTPFCLAVSYFVLQGRSYLSLSFFPRLPVLFLNCPGTSPAPKLSVFPEHTRTGILLERIAHSEVRGQSNPKQRAFTAVNPFRMVLIYFTP